MKAIYCILSFILLIFVITDCTGEKPSEPELDNLNNTTQTYTLLTTDTTTDVETYKPHLGYLEIDSGSISPLFSPDVKVYHLGVADSVSNINLSTAALASSDYVSLSDTLSYTNTNTFSLDLTNGINSVTIIVTEDGGYGINEYVVHIYRYSSGEMPGLSDLSSSVAELTPDFHPDTNDYLLKTTFETLSISLKGYLSNQNDFLLINGSNVYSGEYSPEFSLSTGSNSYNIDVIRGDGVVTQSYSITAYRYQSNEGTPFELQWDFQDWADLSSNQIVDSKPLVGVDVLPLSSQYLKEVSSNGNSSDGALLLTNCLVQNSVQLKLRGEPGRLLILEELSFYYRLSDLSNTNMVYDLKTVFDDGTLECTQARNIQLLTNTQWGEKQTISLSGINHINDDNYLELRVLFRNAIDNSAEILIDDISLTGRYY